MLKWHILQWLVPGPYKSKKTQTKAKQKNPRTFPEAPGHKFSYSSSIRATPQVHPLLEGRRWEVGLG